MDKKFLYILTAVFAFSLFSVPRLKAQTANMSIKIESETDTIYSNQAGRIVVSFYKKSWFPSRIKIQRLIRYDVNASRTCAIFLEISKDGTVYKSMNAMLVKYSKESFLISKRHPVIITGSFDVGEAFTEELLEKIKNHQDGYHWNSKNTDFGVYQLRAVYYAESGDTIYSNPVLIHYLEK